MRALAILELSRFWAPTPTYLQAHGPVRAPNEAPATLPTSRGVTHEEKSHEHRTS